jgi:hypothetical protein
MASNSMIDRATGIVGLSVAVPFGLLQCYVPQSPSDRIEPFTDDIGLAEVYSIERHQLHIACTRARDVLLVAGVAPMSEFLDSLGDAQSAAAG